MTFWDYWLIVYLGGHCFLALAVLIINSWR